MAYKKLTKQDLKQRNFIEQHLPENGHLFDRHVNKTTAEHIDRILDTNTEKPTLRSSSFTSKNQMFSVIKEALRDERNLNNINQWLNSDRKNELQIEYTTKNKNIIGRGVSVDPKTRKIAEYETNSMILRLAKNSSLDHGFAIVTAFPVLTQESKATNRDLRNDMQQTNTYQNANPIDQTLYNIVCSQNYDPDTFSVGTAGPKHNHHTLYLSQLDPENPAYTHRFSFNVKKCLFQTYKSMDSAREPVKTDFITEKDQFNAISRYHNPKGMDQVYEQMPQFGQLIEQGYQCFQTSMRENVEYRKQNLKQKQPQHKQTTHDTKPNYNSVPRSKRTNSLTNASFVTETQTQQTAPDII